MDFTHMRSYIYANVKLHTLRYAYVKTSFYLLGTDVALKLEKSDYFMNASSIYECTCAHKYVCIMHQNDCRRFEFNYGNYIRRLSVNSSRKYNNKTILYEL